jgi:PEP-CTERM motif
MKKFATVLTVALLSLSTGRVWADGIGLTVTGVLTLFTAGDTPLQPSGTNYLDSAFGAVPPGYGNSDTFDTAVIGPGIEFGVTNGADLLTVDYTGTTVTVTDTCLNSACGTTPYTLAMYSPYITGYTIASYNFPDVVLGFGDTLYFPGNAGALTFQGASNFTGGSITFDYTSIAPPPVVTPSSLRFSSFSLASDPPDPPADPPAVPEPATFGLVGTGLLGVAGIIRRSRA